MSIQVNELKKIYGEQKAVDGISFSAGKGQVTGFLGPNGAGKSTTMKMITGYLSPDGGSATVCGIDVTKQPLAAKSKIGYLPEANPLYYDMYVREYLEFVAGLHKIEKPAQRIEEVITMVGLTPERTKKIGQLSKGYKQRVGLAAAILHDPEVLILDEPTTGLDPNQIVEIREVIKMLGKDKTILFSSHIMQEVEAVCDRVIIINKGKLVADDTLDNLRSQSAAQQVQVRFAESVDPSQLAQVAGVTAVNAAGENEWSLACADAAETRKALLAFAVDHNLNIVSLQSGVQKLEEVFRNLTGKV
ncbi:MAG: gliding motility-associated ABC transporter ATP-binding subunit GldA [Bacteroidota bacterium]|nr:gliding motility-associated ABC transporter ATP-binding subunit GldA [Bacteroidota bacterium]